MSNKTKLDSYENRPVKRLAHSLALAYHPDIDKLVTLGGNSGTAVLDAYKPFCHTLVLVEHDEHSYTKLYNEIRQIKKGTPEISGRVKVKKGDILDHLPRRKDNNVLDLDCEHTIRHKDVQRLLPAIKGRNWVLTTSFRGMGALENIPNEFLTSIGKKRSHGKLTLLRKIDAFNSSGRFGFIKKYLFSDTDGHQYIYITYRDGRNACLMTIITPKN